MSTFQTVEEARNYFINDRFAAVNGMTVEELYEDGALCALTLGEDHRNAIGGVMGGAIYTLADFAYAVAANNEHLPTVALTANTQFLAQPKGNRLFARALREKSGKTTCVYRIDVTDDGGRAIALVIITGYKL